MVVSLPVCVVNMCVGTHFASTQGPCGGVQSWDYCRGGKPRGEMDRIGREWRKREREGEKKRKEGGGEKVTSE